MPESPQSVIENTLLSLIKRFREKFTSRECFLYSENFRKQWLNIFVTLKVQQHVNGIWISITDMIPTSGQSQIIGKKKIQCESFTMWVFHKMMKYCYILYNGYCHNKISTCVVTAHPDNVTMIPTPCITFFLCPYLTLKKYIYINVSISSL